MRSLVSYSSVFFLCSDHGQTISMSTKKNERKRNERNMLHGTFFLFYQQNCQVGTTVEIIKKKKPSTSPTMCRWGCYNYESVRQSRIV